MGQLKNTFRIFCSLAFLFALKSHVLPTVLAADGPLPPANLRVEYLSDPLGIDVKQPRFFWVLDHTERGQKQSAYQILVATRTELLAQDKGDQWDTGKVASDQSTQVVYAGKSLESGRTYFWKVRAWDAQGRASDYSRTAQFEMGLLVPEEWKAHWIAGGNQLRKEFSLPSKVVRARAYVTALGYYELRLNGRKVGENVLDPAWTTYDKRILYVTYDITEQLHQGANAVGAMLGNGWAVPPQHYGPPIATPYSSPALFLQIQIEMEGGKQLTVVSDTSWKATQGAITSDSIYDGETYDARREMPGWDSPGFNDSSWQAAREEKSPGGVLSAQMMPPIRVIDTLVPVKMTNPRPGVFVYDMGQNFSGWAELRVSGPRGAAVTMRFAELVYDDGMINRETIRRAKARDTYILRGEGVETWEPRFTYHGFRYVEVTGFPGTPSLDSLRGRLVHSAVEPIGSFAASNPTLNAIQKIIRWGQRTNLHSVPTDCDQRDERMGWMGDAHVTAEEAMLNFDMAAFYTNFVRDIRDVQGADGTITDTVPHKYGSRPADPAWGTAYPLICWYMWEQYGDRRILEENYDGLKKYVEFLRTKAPDNVLRYSYYGDWVAIEKTPGALVSDFYFYYDVQVLAKIAKLLGKSADEQTYTQLGAQIKEAFHREFYDPKRGVYANGSQTANALPLFLDMVPKDAQGAVSGSLFNDIVYAHDSHVTTGFIGVKYLLPLLTRNGEADLAYDLAAKTTYPSWGYMIENGATTLWELWQKRLGPSMNSHNHPMMGSIGAWFYQALAGINAETPGYGRVRIEPHAVRDLKWASASTESVRGTIASSWKRSPGTITVDVAIPVNSVATVTIPKEEEMTEVTVQEGERIVWENGKFVPGTSGVTGGHTEGKNIVLEVGSGRYSFRLTGQ
ncbi:MAG: family 78 glycoside hydrolase catalytic domain [Terriglobia bacterium]